MLPGERWDISCQAAPDVPRTPFVHSPLLLTPSVIASHTCLPTQGPLQLVLPGEGWDMSCQAAPSVPRPTCSLPQLMGFCKFRVDTEGGQVAGQGRSLKGTVLYHDGTQ